MSRSLRHELILGAVLLACVAVSVWGWVVIPDVAPITWSREAQDVDRTVGKLRLLVMLPVLLGVLQGLPHLLGGAEAVFPVRLVLAVLLASLHLAFVATLAYWVEQWWWIPIGAGILVVVGLGLSRIPRLR